MSARHDDTTHSGFAYQFEWGLDGVAALAPGCDVIVVVDVLRFTTAVSVAVEAGAIVLPFTWDDDRAVEHAARCEAVLAGRGRGGGPSLSPTDLASVPAGTRIVLPSPNGAAIAIAAIEAGTPFVLAGSLRNATATARRALTLAGRSGEIGVIAAGEQWTSTDGPLRPAVEDLLGAGAVLHALDPSGAVNAPRCSPDARAARAAFLDARPALLDHMAQSPSGRELVGRGWRDDVEAASVLDATTIAAQLVDGAFVAV